MSLRGRGGSATENPPLLSTLRLRDFQPISPSTFCPSFFLLPPTRVSDCPPARQTVNRRASNRTDLRLLCAFAPPRNINPPLTEATGPDRTFTSWRSHSRRCRKHRPTKLPICSKCSRCNRCNNNRCSRCRCPRCSRALPTRRLSTRRRPRPLLSLCLRPSPSPRQAMGCPRCLRISDRAHRRPRRLRILNHPTSPHPTGPVLPRFPPRP